MSPEILNNIGTTKVSDYYAIGVIIYELLIGEPPFITDNIQKLYELIKKEKVKIPTFIDDDSIDIIVKLMEKDPTKRLGYNSIDEIKSHKFFNSISWSQIQNKEYKVE